MALENIA